MLLAPAVNSVMFSGIYSMTRDYFINSLRSMLIPAVAAILVSGCVSAPLYNDAEPAPVEDYSTSMPDDGDRSASYEEGTVAIAPYQPAAGYETTSSQSRAVGELLQTARTQQQAGNLTEAVATVERALRIEPRNARLWNQLAHLRLEQQQPALAAELAAKSNVLAAADVELKRDNWLLIGQARRATGDIEGARTAEQKAHKIY
jgi:Flp pilus assembly protein TadD